MEISPIPGVRVMPVAKVRPVDSELTLPFEVESAARAEDDTYSHRNQKASGAEEFDEDSEEVDEFLDDDEAAKPAATLRRQNADTQINFLV
jgi:hypothetical protein